MAPTPTHDGDLDQVVELNRLFLRLLRARTETPRACFGLDTSTVRRLKRAPAEVVNELAELPRALFSLNLDPARPPTVMDPGEARLDSATRSMQLTVLLTAWNLSRRSAYSARLFLGLTEEQVAMLKVLPLSDLPPLAAADGLVSCAFEQTAWLWRELLSASRAEHRRQLLLVALQPQTLVAREPARRAFGS